MKIYSIDSRVYLNTLNRNDAKPLEVIGNDYEIFYNTPSVPYPYSMEHAVVFVESAIEKYMRREEFHMGIRLQSNELIGMCALSNIDLTNKKAELGYWLGKMYWGKGYATEALNLMLGFGFDKLDLNKIYAKVLSYNERSIKLLSSLKFSKEGINRQDIFHMGKFFDDISFGLLKKEYVTKYKIDIEN